MQKRSDDGQMILSVWDAWFSSSEQTISANHRWYSIIELNQSNNKTILKLYLVTDCSFSGVLSFCDYTELYCNHTIQLALSSATLTLIAEKELPRRWGNDIFEWPIAARICSGVWCSLVNQNHFGMQVMNTSWLQVGIIHELHGLIISWGGLWSERIYSPHFPSKTQWKYTSP